MTQRRPVLYLSLIAAYPVLYLYARNASEVPPLELIRPLVVVTAVAAVIWGALWLATRDPHRAGLLATLALIYFGTIAGTTSLLDGLLDYLSGFWIVNTHQLPQLVVVIPATLFFGLIAYLIARKLVGPSRFTLALNVFSTALVVMASVQAYEARSAFVRHAPQAFPTLAALDPKARKPDIYYIILDGFARADLLRDTFGYDIEPFLKHLEDRGFYVARAATANYGQTPLSVSCSLNGTYHTERPGDELDAQAVNPALFRDNAVVRSLRPLGYRFVTFASGFDFTDGPYSDVHLSPYRYATAFQRMLLDWTPFGRFLPGSEGRDSYTMTRERTDFLFETLPEIARWPGPTFTFAHVLSPHPPFVFGQSGEDVSPHWKPYYLNDGNVYSEYYGNDDSYIDGYQKQAAYLVKRAWASIDAILDISPEPPVIILQSDHGSGLHLHTGMVERTDLHERMSVLNAYYLPDGRREGLRPGISPVNAFRIVFNNVFGTSLPILPDESYYSGWGKPFQFTRVTDQVVGPPRPPVEGAPPAKLVADGPYRP